MVEGFNVLSVEERKFQEECEAIASVLRDATSDFIIKAAQAGIDLNHLKLGWEYNDGSHIINGGI